MDNIVTTQPYSMSIHTLFILTNFACLVLVYKMRYISELSERASECEFKIKKDISRIYESIVYFQVNFYYTPVLTILVDATSFAKVQKQYFELKKKFKKLTLK